MNILKKNLFKKQNSSINLNQIVFLKKILSMIISERLIKKLFFILIKENLFFQVTKRLEEEESRIKDYIHPTTFEKLIPKIEEILITNQLERIYIEAKELVHKEKIEGTYKKAFEGIHNFRGHLLMIPSLDLHYLRLFLFS